MTAKRLVLGMFGALDDETLPISKLIAGGRVFAIEETAVRMAANRLVNDGVLALVERGRYGIGQRGESLYEASRTWQSQEQRLKPWAGEWFCVHVSHLGRSDRKVLRARLRAFALGGFAALEDGLWIRPCNLAVTAPALAQELTTLGLDDGAFVCHATEIVHHKAGKIRALWDRKSLESSYQAALTAMARSESSLQGRSIDAAAKEVHEIGASVVSVLTHDPLLPESFVDVDLRKQLHQAMLSYDALGKSIWTALFQEDASQAALTG